VNGGGARMYLQPSVLSHGLGPLHYGSLLVVRYNAEEESFPHGMNDGRLRHAWTA
jgi:hypothetical protein